MRTLPSPLLIVAFAVFCGASIDAAVKYVAADITVITIMGWRFFIAGIFVLSLYVYLNKPKPSWEAIRFHALRGAIQTVAALTFFWSLTQLALAEGTVVGFTAALMVAPIARVVLGEKLSPIAGLAALVGFVGAIIAVSGTSEGAPENANRVLGIISCLIAAVCYALTLVLLRLRTRKEDTFTIVMFTNVMPAIILFPYLMVTDPVPPVSMLPIYFGFAVAGVVVWWLMTIGYAQEEAQKLAPLEYTALIWAALFGWAIFEEVPSWQLWLGSIVIIGACLIVAFETRFRARKTAKLPASDILE